MLHQFRNVDTDDPIGGVTTPAVGDLISVALPTITTPAHGCLAVAVQIYSDNSDDVTGATLNGETGGTWTKAGELLGITGGPDGGLAVFVAEMPTAGTISGGSVNPNPTTPVNSVSLRFGFFLRGKPV